MNYLAKNICNKDVCCTVGTIYQPGYGEMAIIGIRYQLQSGRHIGSAIDTNILHTDKAADARGEATTLTNAGDSATYAIAVVKTVPYQ